MQVNRLFSMPDIVTVDSEENINRAENDSVTDWNNFFQELQGIKNLVAFQKGFENGQGDCLPDDCFQCQSRTAVGLQIKFQYDKKLILAAMPDYVKNSRFFVDPGQTMMLAKRNIFWWPETWIDNIAMPV